MLDGTGNAEGHVQLGCDDLAGLSDLHVVRHVARVYRGARSADRGSEAVGEPVQVVEVRGAADAPPAGNHDAGGLQVRPFAAGGFKFPEAGMGGDLEVAFTVSIAPSPLPRRA